jgi:hypothetical protein
VIKIVYIKKPKGAAADTAVSFFVRVAGQEP